MKLLSVVIGGSAVVAMGALAVSINQEHSAPDTVLADMNIGTTSTQSGAPTVLGVPMAVPSANEPIEMNIGPTMMHSAAPTVHSSAPTALDVPMAVPEHKGPAALPPEQAAACLCGPDYM